MDVNGIERDPVARKELELAKDQKRIKGWGNAYRKNRGCYWVDLNDGSHGYIWEAGELEEMLEGKGDITAATPAKKEPSYTDTPYDLLMGFRYCAAELKKYGWKVHEPWAQGWKKSSFGGETYGTIDLAEYHKQRKEELDKLREKTSGAPLPQSETTISA